MLCLHVEQMAAVQARQLELFGDPEPLETIQTTVARLAATLGVHSFIPRLREDYRPEQAWEMTTLGKGPRGNATTGPGRLGSSNAPHRSHASVSTMNLPALSEGLSD